MSFVLSYEEVSVIIPGFRTPEHVHSNTTGLFKIHETDKLVIEELGKNELSVLLNLIQKQG